MVHFSDHLGPLLVDSVSDIREKAQVRGSQFRFSSWNFFFFFLKKGTVVAPQALCPPRAAGGGGTAERLGEGSGLLLVRTWLWGLGLLNPPANSLLLTAKTPPTDPHMPQSGFLFFSLEWLPVDNLVSILAMPGPSGRPRWALSCCPPPPPTLDKHVEAAGYPLPHPPTPHRSMPTCDLPVSWGWSILPFLQPRLLSPQVPAPRLVHTWSRPHLNSQVPSPRKFAPYLPGALVSRGSRLLGPEILTPGVLISQPRTRKLRQAKRAF